MKVKVLTTGRTLLHYRILEQSGEGGMGDQGSRIEISVDL